MIYVNNPLLLLLLFKEKRLLEKKLRELRLEFSFFHIIIIIQYILHNSLLCVFQNNVLQKKKNKIINYFYICFQINNIISVLFSYYYLKDNVI